MTATPGGTIRKAHVTDATALHALTGRSALYWGCEPEFLEWEPEAIAVTPSFALAGHHGDDPYGSMRPPPVP